MKRIIGISMIVSVIAIAVWSFTSNPMSLAEEPAPPPAPQPAGSAILIYSDQSPGALLYAETWKRIGRLDGSPTLFVTDVNELVCLLPSEVWSRVIVIARYGIGEPAYAAALREYGGSHPEVPITLFTWHDNGAGSALGSAAIGSAAIATWGQGSTAGVYVFVDSGGGEY